MSFPTAFPIAFGSIWASERSSHGKQRVITAYQLRSARTCCLTGLDWKQRIIVLYDKANHCKERLYPSNTNLFGLTKACPLLRDHTEILVIVRHSEVVVFCRNLLQALLFGAEASVT